MGETAVCLCAIGRPIWCGGRAMAFPTNNVVYVCQTQDGAVRVVLSNVEVDQSQPAEKTAPRQGKGEP